MTNSTLASSTGEGFVRPPHNPTGAPADAETIQRNAAAARRFAERVLGAGDMEVFEELVADDVWVSTGLKPDSPVTSKAEYASVIGSTLGAALTNGEMTIHEVLPTLDGAVIVRFTARADHTGEIEGISPNNMRLYLSETHLMRFRDGKLVENYVGALNPLQWEMIYSPGVRQKLGV